MYLARMVMVLVEPVVCLSPIPALMMVVLIKYQMFFFFSNSLRTYKRNVKQTDIEWSYQK